jgi:hypothetical protein
MKTKAKQLQDMAGKMQFWRAQYRAQHKLLNAAPQMLDFIKSEYAKGRISKKGADAIFKMVEG